MVIDSDDGDMVTTRSGEPCGVETFGDLLAEPGVREECVLRSRFGFMAFHGGGLEAATDVIAAAAAERAGASYYAVLHPAGDPPHLPSTRFDPQHSTTMASFIDHVDVVVTVHGFGRRGLFSSMLLGGQNRDLAQHLADELAPRLPAYRVVSRADDLPRDLAGMHPANPVNLPRLAGVQLELPPRVRGESPMWWDFEGDMCPHTETLIDALATAAQTWSAAVPA